MDVSKPVIYRTAQINTATLESGRTLRGITIENADYSNIEVVGYTEKRAAADGVHASDVYYGRRLLDLAGHVYGTSLAEVFDFLHVLRSIFSPTSAYIESPGDRGFLPLTFSQPTLDIESFPGGTVPLLLNVRPLTPVTFQITRDRITNGKPERPSALAWSTRLMAKDPRVYVNPEQGWDVSGAAGGPFAANATNRGDYETPMNIMLIIGAAVPPVGTFRLKIGEADIRIKIEAKANVIYRWMGDDRVLMTQDVAGGVTTNPLVLRMDLVTWGGKNHKLMVPASINPPSRPFATAFNYWRTGMTLAAGSRVFWSEAFA